MSFPLICFEVSEGSWCLCCVSWSPPEPTLAGVRVFLATSTYCNLSRSLQMVLFDHFAATHLR